MFDGTKLEHVDFKGASMDHWLKEQLDDEQFQRGLRTLVIEDCDNPDEDDL